jgi:hypothetical protein
MWFFDKEWPRSGPGNPHRWSNTDALYQNEWRGALPAT